MEERIARLEAQNLAFGLTLGHLVAATWPEKENRDHVRDVCCDCIEANFEQPLNSVGHDRLHAVLHELEELFQFAGAAAEAIPRP